MSDAVEKMVTLERATRVARKLFPDEYHDGRNCHQEKGRSGRCRICDAQYGSWMHRVVEVRVAMMEAFS